MLWAVFIVITFGLMLACGPVRKALVGLFIIAMLGWEFMLAVLAIGVAVGLAGAVLEARAEKLAG